jgi:hypothetical protein
LGSEVSSAGAPLCSLPDILARFCAVAHPLHFWPGWATGSLKPVSAKTLFDLLESSTSLECPCTNSSNQLIHLRKQSETDTLKKRSTWYDVFLPMTA